MGNIRLNVPTGASCFVWYSVGSRVFLMAGKRERGRQVHAEGSRLLFRVTIPAFGANHHPARRIIVMIRVK